MCRKRRCGLGEPSALVLGFGPAMWSQWLHALDPAQCSAQNSPPDISAGFGVEIQCSGGNDAVASGGDGDSWAAR